jgi:adenine phosphoribosyltransferase
VVEGCSAWPSGTGAEALNAYREPRTNVAYEVRQCRRRRKWFTVRGKLLPWSIAEMRRDDIFCATSTGGTDMPTCRESSETRRRSQYLVRRSASPVSSLGVTGVVAIEARGFVVGALTAQYLGVGLVLARKPGSIHPDSISQVSDQNDWRGRQVELAVSRRSIKSGDRLVLVDDWIETGCQARTAAQLVASLGASVVATSVIVDDTTAEVRDSLNVVSLIAANELGASS